jgi:hypothetical protein
MKLKQALRDLSDEVGPDKTYDDYLHEQDATTFAEVSNLSAACVALATDMDLGDIFVMAILTAYRAGGEDAKQDTSS